MSSQTSGLNELGKAAQPSFGKAPVVAFVVLLAVAAIAAGAAVTANGRASREAALMASENARRQLESAPFPAHVTGIPASELAISPIEEGYRFPGIGAGANPASEMQLSPVEEGYRFPGLKPATSPAPAIAIPQHGTSYFGSPEMLRAVEAGLDVTATMAISPVEEGLRFPSEEYMLRREAMKARNSDAPAGTLAVEIAAAEATLASAEARLDELSSPANGEAFKYWELAAVSAEVSRARREVEMLNARSRLIQSGEPAFSTQGYWDRAAEWAESNGSPASGERTREEREWMERYWEHGR